MGAAARVKKNAPATVLGVMKTASTFRFCFTPAIPHEVRTARHARHPTNRECGRATCGHPHWARHGRAGSWRNSSFARTSDLSTFSPSISSRLSIAEHSASAKSAHPLPLDALAALEKRAFPRSDAWSHDDLRAEGGKKAALLLVAAADPASPSLPVAGYLAAAATGTSLHILRVATHPDARRKGVASALVRAALSPDPTTTRRRRPLSATLHVDPLNEAALALYSRAGFKADARLEDYYAPGRPALRMILEFE